MMPAPLRHRANHDMAMDEPVEQLVKKTKEIYQHSGAATQTTRTRLRGAQLMAKLQDHLDEFCGVSADAQTTSSHGRAHGAFVRTMVSQLTERRCFTAMQTDEDVPQVPATCRSPLEVQLAFAGFLAKYLAAGNDEAARARVVEEHIEAVPETDPHEPVGVRELPAGVEGTRRLLMCCHLMQLRCCFHLLLIFMGTVLTANRGQL